MNERSEVKTSAYWIPKGAMTGNRNKDGHRIVIADGRELLYSEHDRIPAVGETINVTCNGWGTAKVAGYFTEDGFLGVICTPKKAPDWFVRQEKVRGPKPESNPIGRGNIGVYGAEFALV